MKRKMLLFALVFPAIISQKLQAQTSSRLVASSDWVNNGVAFYPVDSTYYNYSNGRGGDLTHTLKYDNATELIFVDSASGYGYENYYVQTFDANNNLTSVTYQYWNGSAWVISTCTLYTYNANNQVDTMTQQVWGGTAFVPVSQDVYSYNSAGNLYIDLYSVWDALTLTFDNSSQKTYVYDPTNTYIVNETDEAWVSGYPVYTNQYNYTYSAGFLVNSESYTWNGTTFVPSGETTLSYTGSAVTSKLVTSYDATDGSFVSDSLYTYGYSGGSIVPQSCIVQTWSDTGGGVWNNIMEYAYTYNSYNQLTSSTGTAWNVVGLFEHASGDPMANYYYATYTPGISSVKNISNNGGTANIYPVPAQNMLHIDLTWDVAQTATITIFDVQGNVVRQWTAPAGTQYNSAVAVNGFADGTYFVKINGQQGQVEKQFVVTH